MKHVFHYKDIYYPLEYIDHKRLIVRCVLVNEKNEVALLFVKGDDKFGHRECYELPGGGKKKEETFHQALYREIQEETGFSAKNVQFLGKVIDYYNLIHRENHIYYYLARTDKYIGNNLEEYEKKIIQKVLFVNIDDAIQMMKNVQDDGVGMLVKQREVPILQLAKEILEK